MQTIGHPINQINNNQASPAGPIRPPQIARWLENLNEQISHNTQNLNTLHDKLIPCLRENVPPDKSEGQQSETEAMLCPLANELRICTNNVEQNTRILISILDRLEL